jgi:hypothetical protein
MTRFLTMPVLYGLVAALLGMSALAGVQTLRLASAKATAAELREVLLQERAAAATEALAESEKNRIEERRRSIVAQEKDRDAKQKLDSLRAAAYRADAAAVELHRAAAAAAARCGTWPDDPIAPVDREAATRAGMVLADVLGRMEARGRQLALLADERGNAGATCEQLTDAMTVKQ